MLFMKSLEYDNISKQYLYIYICVNYVFHILMMLPILSIFIIHIFFKNGLPLSSKIIGNCAINKNYNAKGNIHVLY